MHTLLGNTRAMLTLAILLSILDSPELRWRIHSQQTKKGI